ncbi:histidyl-tRNA synthetase [Limimonas halophila]|uniref:Histidine--tRNA ligase n=1 Tax=Limimonas halophila TaxID=1082479 RepID=A0A1G7PY35_9PROT|nr:histidine--tRNA ligase [Limimonas halophila]SDF91212.1 histidyl-tRNA synthetase [Limimonas halophila]
MRTLQPVRGTRDILPAEMRRHRAVAETARRVAAQYGYEQMATPVFEFTEVFKRTLGEHSDVVMKEMYTFPVSEEGDTVTLRPEGTAGFARAYIANGMQQNLPVKAFYTGPMFRHERPQKGRLRQFHQVGVELLGPSRPLADVEIIAMGQQVLAELGLSESITLELNTLGDLESRKAYRAALVEYFAGFKDKLSADSRHRLDRNPLRILDSKDEGDQAVVADAPTFGDYLNQHSQDFFGQVCEGLDALGIGYRLNSRLVRGLDYYSHTCFEFTTTALGAQGTVLAGGRYDDLIETMGGPATPGTGWAAGIERLSMLMDRDTTPTRPVAVVPAGGDAEMAALRITQDLRGRGFTVDMGYSGNMKKRLKRANNAGACAAVILGGDELAQSVATVRNLDTGEQETVALDQLPGYLARYQPG